MSSLLQFLTSFSLFFLVSSQSEPSNTAAERLCTLVNDYREENGKSRIPFSVTLMRVGSYHVTNVLDATTEGVKDWNSKCNLHTWYPTSSTPDMYTKCCYFGNHSNANCMWNKPNEISTSSDDLTTFSSSGFENAALGYSDISAALEGWKGSSGHNDVMLNNGIWSGTFQGIGAGADETNKIYFLWFAYGTDPNEYFSDTTTTTNTPGNDTSTDDSGAFGLFEIKHFYMSVSFVLLFFMCFV